MGKEIKQYFDLALTGVASFDAFDLLEGLRLELLGQGFRRWPRLLSLDSFHGQGPANWRSFWRGSHGGSVGGNADALPRPNPTESAMRRKPIVTLSVSCPIVN